MGLVSRARVSAKLVRAFGPWTAARLSAPRRGTVLIRSPDLQHPVELRSGTSDPETFLQVVVEKEYLPIASLPDIAAIIDLGANAGFSSAFFLSRYPAARCIAIEPDPGNFTLLSRNLKSYGNRAICVQGGVWSRSCRLAPVLERYRDGAEWSRQVRECRSGAESSVPGFDVPALMSMMGVDRISILKVDIEGAEAVVFGPSSAAWIDLVDHIAIELHDDSTFGMASPVFWRAVLDRGFSFSRSGELVIATRGSGRR
jgi:FkbM family methyltransferase